MVSRASRVSNTITLKGSSPSCRVCVGLFQASRILANLIVAGGTVVFRAATQAWKQAVISKTSLCSAQPQLTVHLHICLLSISMSQMDNGVV